MSSVLLLIVSMVFASGKDDRPELAAGRIPDALKQDAYDVIRESETTYTISTPREYLLRVHQSVTILDKRSKLQVLYVPYDQYSKARISFAAIYDQNGALIRKMKKEDIEDMSAVGDATLYSDTRILGLQLIGGSLPYSISYDYEISYNATRGYHDWEVQGYHTAVEDARLEVISPKGLQIESKALNGVPAPHEQIDATGLLHRKWTLADKPAMQYEDLAPPAHELFPAVYLAPHTFQIAGYTGTMADWKGFGAFIQEINAGRETLSPQMSARVHELISDSSSDTEKIRVLYNYLKAQMRYVSVQIGIGGWQAYDAQYVERNKYGDCKALSYFMKGMLTEAGIEAYPVLIGESGFFAEDFVTPGSFNHMMLYVPTEDMWLECTSSENPAGYIYDATSDQDVVLITPDGGVVSRTPSTSLEEATTETYDSLWYGGEYWHVDGTHVYREGDQQLCRSIQRYLAQSDREKRFREKFPLSIHTLENLVYSSEADQPTGTCAYAVELSQYGSVSGPRLFLPVNPQYRQEFSCSTAPRVHDIYTDTPVRQHNRISIVVPEGYVVESVPSDKSLSDERFGSYSLSVTNEGSVLHIDRDVSIPRMRLPKDAYPELCAFYKGMEAGDRAVVVLKKE